MSRRPGSVKVVFAFSASHKYKHEGLDLASVSVRVCLCVWVHVCTLLGGFFLSSPAHASRVTHMSHTTKTLGAALLTHLISLTHISSCLPWVCCDLWPPGRSGAALNRTASSFLTSRNVFIHLSTYNKWHICCFSTFLKLDWTFAFRRYYIISFNC